jgi:hypothetical protein
MPIKLVTYAHAETFLTSISEVKEKKRKEKKSKIIPVTGRGSL